MKRRPGKHKTVRRPRRAARKVRRPAVRRPARKIAERGPATVAAFWEGGDLSAFMVEIAPSAVPGGTLKRLGPPPLGPDSGAVERTLRRTYAAATALALSLARK